MTCPSQPSLRAPPDTPSGLSIDTALCAPAGNEGARHPMLPQRCRSGRWWQPSLPARSVHSWVAYSNGVLRPTTPVLTAPKLSVLVYANHCTATQYGYFFIHITPLLFFSPVSATGLKRGTGDSGRREGQAVLEGPPPIGGLHHL